MYASKLCVLMWFINAIGIKAEQCKSCSQITRFYNEIGCEPIYDSTDTCCPSKYNCPTNDNITRCYVREKIFEIGQRITQSQDFPCSNGCICSQKGNSAGFKCPVLDCGEFNTFSQQKKCVAQFERQLCCPTRSVCDPNEIEKLSVCSLDGKIYRENQFMNPTLDPCYKCFCDRQFVNTTGPRQNKNCRPITCGIQIYNGEKIQAGCAPIYLKPSKLCCPINYRCPVPSDYILAGNGRQIIVDNKGICAFGTLQLKVGDSLNSSNDACTVCTCNIPPFVECVKTLNCQ